MTFFLTNENDIYDPTVFSFA